MNFSEIISSIMDNMRSAGGVEVAFGNPHTINDLTIIPVAKVSYGFGAGGGKSGQDKLKMQKSSNGIEPTENKEPESPEVVKQDEKKAQGNGKSEDNFGGGGGGGMKTQPIGVFVVHKEQVRFMPVITVKEVSVAVGLLLLTLWRIFRKKR